MPELPEVETTRRGIEPWITGRRVAGVEIRERRLRRPITRGLAAALTGERIETVARRAKYLLLGTSSGTVILHLGMSGSLRICRPAPPPGAHDHVDIGFDDGRVLRFTDPRRFGLLLWTRDDPLAHPLLSRLGPEPLGEGFDGRHLHALSRGRRAAVKSFVMDGRVVVGVGNIYASESLHRAGIHPLRAAGRISAARYERLAQSIRDVLGEAIEAGGTTLRDFTDSDGRPGYFAHHLSVYGQAGNPCPGCGRPISQRVIGQRASYFCVACQR
jgi:formamidopyrimidine-DNA glycosylase